MIEAQGAVSPLTNLLQSPNQGIAAYAAAVLNEIYNEGLNNWNANNLNTEEMNMLSEENFQEQIFNLDQSSSVHSQSPTMFPQQSYDSQVFFSPYNLDRRN